MGASPLTAASAAYRGRSPHAARSLPVKMFLGNIANKPQIREQLQKIVKRLIGISIYSLT